MKDGVIERISDSIRCSNRCIVVRTNEHRLLLEQLAVRFHNELRTNSMRLLAYFDNSVQSVQQAGGEDFDLEDLLNYRAVLVGSIVEELNTLGQEEGELWGHEGDKFIEECYEYASKEPLICHVIIFPSWFDSDSLLEPKKLDHLLNDSRGSNLIFLFNSKRSPYSWADDEDSLLFKTAPVFTHELERRNERIRQIAHLLAKLLDEPFNGGLESGPTAIELGLETLTKNANVMRGLSRSQMERAIRQSILKTGTLDSDFIDNWRTLLLPTSGEEPDEDDNAINVNKPTDTFNDIVGIDPLKEWCRMMSKRFHPSAKEYGFTRYPKGLLLTGVPGCGKSTVAKALSNEMGIPFTRLEPDRFHKCFVGEGERELRETLEKLDARAPLVCFIDEAEKAFGSVEGGRSAEIMHRMLLGMLLQFIEDNRSGVFWVFTSNQIELFPPELVDRFDGRFFIDLPTADMRKEIIQLKMRAIPKIQGKIDFDKLAAISEGFSGRNLEDATTTAMSMAFMNNRAVEHRDLEKSFNSTRPTSVTMQSRIDALRTLVENGKIQLANSAPYKIVNLDSQSEMYG
jgi:AAA+ superfamily predicted ATPase